MKLSIKRGGGITPRQGIGRAGFAGIAALVAMQVVPAASSLASSTSAAPSRPAPASYNTQPASAGAAYWTADRMASAKPVDSSTSQPQHATVAGNSATGAPNVAGGYAPSNLVGPQAGLAVSTPGKTSTGVTPADGGFPGPNDTWNWLGNYKKFPVSTVGKLFFTKPGIGNFVCSAAVTLGNSNQLDMVWTAGHCVGPQGGRAYFTNFLFCPSYKNGQDPAVGCWNWRLAQQTGAWYFNGYWSGDYAYLYVQPTGTVVANHVANVTGALGFAWNFGRDQHWIDLGYPSGAPYSGGLLVATGAEHRYDVTNPGGDTGPADNSIPVSPRS